MIASHKTSFRVLHAFRVSILCACPVMPAVAWAAGPGEKVGQVEVRQRGIKLQASHAVEELDAIIAEFDDSGLSQQGDVKTLRAIRSVLDRLSEKDMVKVIGLLQAARIEPDANRSRHTALDAYSGQKGIILQLRQLVLEYQRRQQLLELSLRFNSLAERQNENLRTVRRLVTLQANGRANPWDETHRIQLGLQQAEQSAIHDETAALLTKLEEFSGDAAADSESDKRVRASIDEAKKANLLDVFQRAGSELVAINLVTAAGDERAARDELRKLARLVVPPKDSSEILQGAAQQLATGIAAETSILDQTQQLPRDGQQEKGFDLEDGQADLVDAVDVIRKDVAELVPEAATDLDAATGSLQESRPNLIQGHRDPAVNAQTDALEKMKSAHARLLAQIDLLARQRQADQSKTDPIADAKDLKAKVDELRKAQDELKAQTQAQGDRNKLAPLAAKQAELTAQTKALAEDALTKEPLATASLKNAVGDMAAAQADLDKNHDNNEAVKAQQSAVEDLADASKNLDKQIAALEQTKKELTQLTAQSAKIGKLISEEAAIHAQTAKVDAQHDAGKLPDTKAAAAPLAQKQDENAKTGQQVKNDLPPTAAEAAQALNDANAEQTHAKQALDQGATKDATPAEQQAIAELVHAKQAVDQQIAADKEQLHQGDGQEAKDAALAAAQQAVDKAQDQTDTAANKLDTPTAADLAKEEKQLAHDVHEAREQGNNSPAVATAEKATEKGAEQLAENKLPEAAQSLGQARAALDQAAQEQAAQAGQPDQNKAPEGNATDQNAAQDAAGHQAGEHADANHAEKGQGQPKSADAQHEANAQAANAQPAAAQEAGKGEHPDGQKADQQAAGDKQAGHEAQAADAGQGDQHHDAGNPQSAEAGQQGQPTAGKQPTGAQPPSGQQAAHAGEPAADSHDGKPTVPELAQRQSGIQAKLQQLMAGLASTQQDLGEAGAQLGQVADQLAQAAAQDPGLIPADAAQDIANASNAAAKAAAQADAGNQEAAGQAAAQAQDALQAAQASLSLADAGLGTPKPSAAPQSAGNGPPQAAVASAQAPGQGQSHTPSGQPHNGPPLPGKGLGQGMKSPLSNGAGHGTDTKGQGDAKSGGEAAPPGASTFVALPQRDRQAIQQSRSEKYPEEYGAMIEQYFKNVSDQESKK
jgi:hypothetical protein